MAPTDFWEIYTRLEPERPNLDLAEGLAVRVGDPAWFLARQWQLGEHQGEDASTPVVVEVEVRRTPIAQAGGDPVHVPPESILEAEPESWWTIGRRLRIGRAVAPRLTPQQRKACAVGPLPAPYDLVDPLSVDGLTVWRRKLLRSDGGFAEVPQPPRDRWDPRTLSYAEEFAVGEHKKALVAAAHDGGPLDWYTVDATAPEPGSAATETARLLVSRLTWPGAPNPRWWQIEDHRVDWAGEGPDRAHLATVLLLEVLTGHGDDWFTFPLPDPVRADGDTGEPPPATGHLVELVAARVLDDMQEEGRDDPWTLAPPPSTWSLFKTAGLAANGLVIVPVVATPVAGPILDRVVFAVDEDADLAWAVELMVEGERLLPDAESLRARALVERLGSSGEDHRFDYAASTPLPPHWHPYRLEANGERTLVQGLVADLAAGHLAGQPPPLRDGPRSTLIGGAPGQRYGRGHRLSPAAFANQGLALERRFVLGRTTNGDPLLWIERSRQPLVAGPTSWLRFDVLTATPTNEP